MIGKGIAVLVAVAASLTPLPLLGGEGAPAPPAPSQPQALRALAGLKPAPEAGSYSWSTGPYQYDGAGNIITIGAQYFTYDVANRLAGAHVISPDLASDQSYVYDPYGNMQTRTTGGIQTSLAASTATNHLTGGGAAYDDGGNLKQWQPPGSSSTYIMTYDPMNMLIDERLQTDGTPRQYNVYTADDERLRTTRSTGVTQWTVRGLDGQVLRTFQVTGSTWTVFREYVHRGGSLLQAFDGAGVVEHFSLDHLGSPRLITDDSGAKIGFHTYLPFGEELGASPQEGEARKFTGHERDADPAGGNFRLDYMHARYYGASAARFLSMDRIGGTGEAPQSWNRYSYARNSPMKAVDPDGNRPAIAYGTRVDVEPGYGILLRNRKNGTLEHGATVLGFIHRGHGQLDGVIVVEHFPHEGNKTHSNTPAADKKPHKLDVSDSNSPAAGGGKWNLINDTVAKVIPNGSPQDGSSYSTANMIGAMNTVNGLDGLTYDPDKAGTLGSTTDCAGAMNLLSNALGGFATMDLGYILDQLLFNPDEGFSLTEWMNIPPGETPQ